jgi:hypothetical protein
MTEHLPYAPTDPELISGTHVTFRLGGHDNQAAALFIRRSIGGRLNQIAREQLPTSDWSIAMLGEYKDLVDSFDGPQIGDKAWLLRHADDCFTIVNVIDGWAHLATASPDIERSEETCAAVASAIRNAQVDEIEITPFTFWGLNPHRFPRPMRRNLDTPSWSEIEENYQTPTRAAMTRLLELRDTPAARMILWHGPPGTGKTHALRALAREWSSWCNVSYISDPEEFIGGTGTYSPTYLFDVANFDAGYGAAEAARRSTLIVLEDAGELMTGEARQRSGQGLSRLLNLTDGLMGQGLKILVLITTNEPLGSLHPAVIRPGRCLAEMGFGELSVDEANQWLEHHGSSVTVEEPTTLAVLYAILSDGLPVSNDASPVGVG